MIKTPDIIPNNLRTIREMRSKNTDETAKAIGINISYMSILENTKANMSGGTALKMIDYFDSSFAAFFGQPGLMELPFTTEKFKSQPIKIMLTEEEYSQFKLGDIVNAIKLVEKDFKEFGMKGSLSDIEEMSSEPIENSDKILVSIKAIISEQQTKNEEFNMNLTNDINLDLYKALRERGFNKDEYYSVSFIEDYLNITKEETQKAIGLTEKGYNQIFEAEKEISVKLMWRLVKFFKVPLELIMNVPIYMKRHL